MTNYIGVKLINAVPMNRLDYNKFRGWELPEDESGTDEGFLVEYIDGGKANTKEYAGYVSWSPKEVFEKAYTSTDGLTFGLAIEAMKKGHKVCRSGWNGKGMYLFVVPGSHFKVNRQPLLGTFPEGTSIEYQPHIDMKTAQDTVVPWLASQSDMLANDWQIVD